MKPVKKNATYDDLCDLPDHFVAEMFTGDLYATPRPALPHSRAASILGAALIGPFDQGRNGPGGWLMLHEPELHFGNDVLVPDIAGWRRERLARTPDAPYLTLAPDWVCEVLSPSTETLDRGEKLRVYGREGVAHVGSSTRASKRSRCWRSTGAGHGASAAPSRAAALPAWHRSTPSSSSSARSGRDHAVSPL